MLSIHPSINKPDYCENRSVKHVYNFPCSSEKGPGNMKIVRILLYFNFVASKTAPLLLTRLIVNFSTASDGTPKWELMKQKVLMFFKTAQWSKSWQTNLSHQWWRTHFQYHHPSPRVLNNWPLPEADSPSLYTVQRKKNKWVFHFRAFQK